MGGMGIVINSAEIDAGPAERTINRVGMLSQTMEVSIVEALRRRSQRSAASVPSVT